MQNFSGNKKKQTGKVALSSILSLLARGVSLWYIDELASVVHSSLLFNIKELMFEKLHLAVMSVSNMRR